MIRNTLATTLYIILGLLMTGCNSPRASHQYGQLPCTTDTGPLAVFIHGTFFPGINLALRAFDLPLGFVPATKVGNKLLHGRIAYAYAKADPIGFPINGFYFFGWSGVLSFAARRKAAEQLYAILKQYQHRHITVIGHSHGGNVALNVAHIAESHNDYSFKIDRLILLATPTLETSKKAAYAPTFKKVYAFYSTGDRTQTRDPQGLYAEVRRLLPGLLPIPFFSGRTFAADTESTPYNGDHTKLIERRMLLRRRNMMHLDFIYQPFNRRLPDILKTVDAHPCTHSQGSKIQHIINIPKEPAQPIERLVKHLE